MKVKSKLMAALGSLKDHAAISAQSLLSSIEIAIVRSTDPCDTPLDDKYVHEILFVISNSPGSITFLARRISARFEAARDPVVALKALVLLHRLVRGGDRYFEQDLRNLWASGDLQLDLRWWLSKVPEPLCSFVVSYSLFLSERMEWIINQAGKLEPVRPPDSRLQTCEDKAAELVLYRVSKCQSFLDRIMDCSPAENVLRSSHVTKLAMIIALRESFRVYDSFCEGTEMLGSSLFELEKPARVLALNILQKARAQTSNLHEFYDRCKKVIMVKSLDYPCVHLMKAGEISSMEQLQPMKDSSTGEEAGVENCESSVNPFSQKLETKISTVWVEFDQEDSQKSSISFGGFDDCFNGEGGPHDLTNERTKSTAGKAMEFL